jgi:hypothetical protein
LTQQVVNVRRIKMPITYRVDRERNLVFETWTGQIGAEDLAMYWQGYLADVDVLEIRRTIVDLRASVITFSGDDLRHLIESVVLPVLVGKKWRTAIVVLGGSVAFGVSRQYQVFAERYSKDSIFESVAEAEKWMCG